MPAQARTADVFSRDNILIGLSTVTFTPAATGSAAVDLGVLSGQTLEKTVETLKLQTAVSGRLTLDREFVNTFEASFNLELFNFRQDIAQYIFGSETPVAQSNTAVTVTNETFNIPLVNPFDQFVNLDQADINESTIEVTCGTITAEAVGTGDGSVNNFVLDFKVKALTDITAAGSITVAGVAYTAIATGAAAAGNEVEVVIAEVDGAHPTTSGSLEFFVGGSTTPPANGAAILATYTPSFSTTGTDIVSLTDYMLDPILGRIRMLDPSGADNSPFRTTGDVQPLEVDYTWNRKAGFNFQPFITLTAEGSATVNHLTDIGVNMLYTIPSVTLRLTDDALVFGAEDFATATILMNINDAGGSDRFGEIQWFSETEANA